MSLLMTIYALCNIRVPDIDKYAKIECIDYYTNCLVGTNGRFMEEKVEQCKKKFVEDPNKNGASK